jgi:hypothetical protein
MITDGTFSFFSLYLSLIASDTNRFHLNIMVAQNMSIFSVVYQRFDTDWNGDLRSGIVLPDEATFVFACFSVNKSSTLNLINVNNSCIIVLHSQPPLNIYILENPVYA